MTSTERPLGLRERKRQETHRNLARTTLRHVFAHGLDSVTVEDIAAEVGVSSRTFFNYFSSKEDALLRPYPGHEERGEQVIARLLATPCEDRPLLVLARVLAGEFQTIDADREEWLDRMTVFERHPQLLHRMALLQAENDRRTITAIAQWLGTPEASMYPVLLFATLGAACRAAMSHWFETRGARPAHELLFEAVAALDVGLPLPADAAPRG
ncbi:AcrR family transcriptional regulator [Crossiella equi]|uniref:AcrR family transcriptional regulator n=1 Tax=Crossiella equi TaxID=130796 RepID=A0ABS5AP21_9PSEU|nr:TetR/AcrR family transcriptional regulator [Crossiella equi]MBP2478324.1 AcrR family transcriptional regulator [Crossiella equi]